MTEITDAEVLEIQWASSEQGKAAVRAAWDKAQRLRLNEGRYPTTMADVSAIVYAAYLAAGWDGEPDGEDEPESPAPTITVTVGHLMDRRLWGRAADMLDMDAWAVNEGRMSRSDTVTLTLEQGRELGMLR